MNYLLKNKTKSEYRRPIISVVVLFFLLSLSGFLFPNVLRSVFFNISKPLWVIGDGVATSFSEATNFFVFKSALVAENTSLKEQLSSLKLTVTDYDVISKDNQDLQNQLGHKNNTNRTIARVLSKPPLSPYDTFVIDVGSAEGVAFGDKVYYSDNIIIGTVSSVTSGTSVVELFSTGNHRQETTLSRTGASFVLNGLGGANFSLEVPKDTDILWGDSFMYPDSSPSLIGSVYYIDTNSQSAFKTIYIRIPGNIFSAKSVFIDKN